MSTTITKTEPTWGSTKKLRVAGCVPCRAAGSSGRQGWAASTIGTTEPHKARPSHLSLTDCPASAAQIRSRIFSFCCRMTFWRTTGLFPSRVQRGAVSVARKQTTYVYVFWRVHREPGTIAKATRLTTSPVCRLHREWRPAVLGRGGVIQDPQLRRMVQEFLGLRG